MARREGKNRWEDKEKEGIEDKKNIMNIKPVRNKHTHTHTHTHTVLADTPGPLITELRGGRHSHSISTDQDLI